MEKQKNREIEAYNDLIKKREVKHDLLRTAELLQRFMFLRTYRGELWPRTSLIVKPLLSEIASRFNMELRDIVQLIPSEITALLSIEERRRNYYWEINGDRVTVDDRPPLEEEKLFMKEFPGQVASRGKARGIVKIIRNLKEISKVEEGDILVTQMTSPDMTIAMSKAAAIITDEGGILCHAAIVSREIGKPCIIGTNVATKVLRNGDLVDVDAEKGVVNILKRLG